MKIENLKTYTTQKYHKDAIKLHDFFYYGTKILPLFKKIEIDNIYKDNTLIIKKIILNKNNFQIISPDIDANGYFKIFKNYSSIFLKRIKYKKYIFNNSYVFTYYTDNYVFSNIKTHFKNKILYIAFKIDNNFIYYSLKTKKIKLKYNNFLLKADNLNIYGKINTSFTYYSAKFNMNLFKLINKNFQILSIKLKGNTQNNIINLQASKTNIKYKNLIKNLLLKKIILTFNLKNRSVISSAENAELFYKNYILYAKNPVFNYYLNDGNFFIHAIDLKLNNDINAKSQELVISKLPKFYFYLKDNKVEHKYFTLNNKIIRGNKSIILFSDILGKILGFHTIISKPKIELNNKIAKTDTIIFNNIKFDNTKINFYKKPFVFSSSTHTLFNKNVLNILKKFGMNIPIIQVKGNNYIKFKIFINNKLKNIIYDINSTDSLFQYNDINFSYKHMQMRGDLNNSIIILKHFSVPNQFLNTLFDSNITINIKNKYINSFTYFYKFNIDHYLNIKNFNEKIVIDLKKKLIFMLNSFIFANLNNNTVYLYSLKKLLKYSIFNKIFTDGNVLIKFFKGKTDIIANSYIKYPLFLNQKNPYNINAVFEIKDNNISIYNRFINAEIINYKTIKASIYNLDIDIQGLIGVIDSTNDIISKISHSNENNSTIKVKIQAKNTNFIYKKHKFLTDEANFYFNKEINFSAKYKKSSLHGYTKNKFLLIEGKNYTKQALVPLFNFFNHFNYINLDFVTVRSPQNFYTGKIYIKKGAIKDLGALNNIIAFINTIPALLTLNNPGFSSKGYKIKKGYINYLFYNNILYFKQIKIKGINIDFDGKGYVDLNKNFIKMKIHTIIKIKLKKIPIIGKGLSYLFFGKDGYLHVNIFVKGNLDNPKISKDMGGGIIESPLKLFKRIITLPFNIF